MYNRHTPLLLIFLVTIMVGQLVVYVPVAHAMSMSTMNVTVEGKYKGRYHDWIEAHIKARIQLTIPTILPFNETTVRLVSPDIIAEGYTPDQNEVVLKHGGAYIIVDKILNMTSTEGYYNIYLQEIVLKDEKSGLPVIAIEPYPSILIGRDIPVIPASIRFFSSSISSLLNGRSSVTLNLTVDKVVFSYDGDNEGGSFHGYVVDSSPKVLTVTIVYTGNASTSCPTITPTVTVTHTQTVTVTMPQTVTETKTITQTKTITHTKTTTTTVGTQTITKTIAKTKTITTTIPKTVTETKRVVEFSIEGDASKIALIIAFVALIIALIRH